MTVRGRRWWAGVAALALVLAGCRGKAPPSIAELAQEMCQEGMLAGPGGRAVVAVEGRCGQEMGLMPSDTRPTHPELWMAMQPEFAEHHIDRVDIGRPPGDAVWVWESTRFSSEKYYWLDKIHLEVAKKPDTLETWAIPLSLLACSGVPIQIGTVECRATVAAKSSREQVSARSWAFGGKAKAAGVLGVELAAKFAHTMKTTSLVEVEQDKKVSSERGPGYGFVANEWQTTDTIVIINAMICQFNSDGYKSCEPFTKGDAKVHSILHIGVGMRSVEPGDLKLPVPLEYDYQLRHQKVLSGEGSLKYKTAFNRTAESSTEAGFKLSPESPLSVANVEAGADFSEGRSQEREVRYEYKVIHDLKKVIPLWVGQLGFTLEGTIVEGPWFLYCPAEGEVNGGDDPNGIRKEACA